MASNERMYPNLAPCRVVLQSTTSSGKPPVSLPQEVLNTVQTIQTPLPPVYDFALEQKVLETRKERDRELSALQANSREDLQYTVLVKMVSITNADEVVCKGILESHSYDLDSSIEEYFQSH